MTDNKCMTESPQTVLYVNDTVTSPLGLYQLVLFSDGLAVTQTFTSTTNYIYKGETDPTSCKLVGRSLVVLNGTTPIWTSPAATFNVKGLVMQDDGTVDLYGPNGQEDPIYSFTAAPSLVILEESHLLSMQAAFETLRVHLGGALQAPRIPSELLNEVTRELHQRQRDRSAPAKSSPPPSYSVFNIKPFTGTGQ